MRRPAFYSPSPQAAATASGDRAQGDRAPADEAAEDGAATPSGPAAAPVAPRRRRIVTAFAVLLAGIGLGTAGLTLWQQDLPRRLTQKDIDAAVLHTLQTTTLPSQAARAAAAVRTSVVRVTALGPDEDTPPARGARKGKPAKPPGPENSPAEVERGVGTGVVIVDTGVILTNLHVVSGADKIRVTFFDGSESDASITGVQADNDLAVLQASKIPDDMEAATMRSTADLQPGDNVAVVGFPFGIGPSVSAGVVSGLKRSFRSPQGKQQMTNLIQFDAAANPGNSGGPLINMDGEVLGIVTAILNPTQARTFIGIGFAVPIENAASAAGSAPF